MNTAPICPEWLAQWMNYILCGILALIVWLVAIIAIGFLCLGIVKVLLYIPFCKFIKHRAAPSDRYSDYACNVMYAVMALLVLAATVGIALLAYSLSSIATAIIFVILVIIVVIISAIF